MKLFITFFIGLLVGYGVNQLKSPEPQPVQVIEPDEKSIELKNKLQVLTETEIEDYYRLKTMEERYQKADEILGKIVLLLLKDIGLRISENAKKEINNPNRNVQIEPVKKTETPQFERFEQLRMQPNPVKARLSYAEVEKKINDIRSPMQAGEFLNGVKIEDFASELSKSSEFTNKNNNLLEVIGKYIGVALVIDNNKNKTWDVEIDISGDLSNSRLRGNSSIKISENGRVFSNSRDRGIIQSLNEFGNDSQATLIRASPSLYFQVYYIKALDSLIGNVYMSGKRNTYERIGTIELKRP